MKSLLLKIFIGIVLLWGTTLGAKADRCEPTQNVELNASTYTGTPSKLTFTLHNYNDYKVTIVATYHLESTNGEEFDTTRNYVLQKDGERQETFDSNVFDKGGLFQAKACCASISTTVCE